MKVFILGYDDGILGVYSTEEKIMKRFRKELDLLKLSKEEYERAILSQHYKGKHELSTYEFEVDSEEDL